MRISDWSSDVCSSDLHLLRAGAGGEIVDRSPVEAGPQFTMREAGPRGVIGDQLVVPLDRIGREIGEPDQRRAARPAPFEYAVRVGGLHLPPRLAVGARAHLITGPAAGIGRSARIGDAHRRGIRSAEHTSELQSLMRTSYAVFCLKK